MLGVQHPSFDGDKLVHSMDTEPTLWYLGSFMDTSNMTVSWGNAGKWGNPATASMLILLTKTLFDMKPVLSSELEVSNQKNGIAQLQASRNVQHVAGAGIETLPPSFPRSDNSRSRFGSIIGKSSSEGIKDLISPVPAVQLWEQRFKVTIQLQHSMRFGWPSKWKAWNRERTSDTAAYSGYWVTKARVPAGIPCRLNMKSTTPKNCAEQNQTSTTESETARDLRLLHRCLSRSGAAPNPTNQYSFPS